MRFTVLGSGTILPNGRGAAGFLVEHGGAIWLVDGGSGTLDRVERAGVDPRDLAGGVVSHRHVDHIADLASLLFLFRVAGRAVPYHLVGAEGLDRHLAALEVAYGDLSFPGGVRLRTVARDAVEIVGLGGGLRVVTAPANHSRGALHLRFEANGRSVVFSGDTGPSQHLARLARGADLLVCECGSSEETPLPGHLAPSDIAAIVADARPGQVWLTHFYPHTDPGRAVTSIAKAGVPVRAAEDGDRWCA